MLSPPASVSMRFEDMTETKCRDLDRRKGSFERNRSVRKDLQICSVYHEAFGAFIFRAMGIIISQRSEALNKMTHCYPI